MKLPYRTYRKPPTEKVCTNCKELKPISEFPLRSKANGWFSSTCVSCVHRMNRSWRSRNKEKLAAYMKAYHLENHPKRYGMDSGWYDRQLAKQNHRCPICGIHQKDVKVRFSIDHDHSCCSGRRSCGKCTRGLLCVKCNAFVGHLERLGEEGIKAALKYLDQAAI